MLLLILRMDQKPVVHKSGLLEISENEPKGTLVTLLKAAKEEEKLLLAEARAALKSSRKAIALVKPYRTDIFGDSFGIRGGYHFRKFRRLIDESLQLAISAKIHLPSIEMIANEVNDWLLKHKADETVADILPEDKKVIAEVRKSKEFLESAIRYLTVISELRWGTATESSGIFTWGAEYIPVEQESSTSDDIKFRSDWMTPLKRSNESLEKFAAAVEDIFLLQKRINEKYRA